MYMNLSTDRQAAAKAGANEAASARGRGKKAALRTLGCKVNAYETDAMKAMLEDAGYEIVPFTEGADVYVINTCSVTNIADRKSRQMISRARKLNPEAVVVAAGCYVQTAVDKTGLSVDADIILGTNRKGELVKLLRDYDEKRYGDASSLCHEASCPEASAASEQVQKSHAAGESCADRESRADTGAGSQRGERAAAVHAVDDIFADREVEPLTVPRIQGHTRASVKVQDGCNMFCSYCIIPYARGRVRSRQTEEVYQEIRNLADSGVKEVVLTGIHLSSYGVDHAADREGTWQERSKLIDLIERVAEVPGIERIRLGSLEPTIITGEFCRRLRVIEKVCPHFHLSLQSGCDAVLERMNRHYTCEDYLERLQRLREAWVRPAITTDVIVGFPGETQEEFETTAAFLEKAQLYETHLFRYSKRAGTKAAAMAGQIEESVKAKRLSRLEKIAEKNRGAFIRTWADEEVSVLIEEETKVLRDGLIRLPNAAGGSTDIDISDLGLRGKKLYSGYTRRYIRVLVPSDEDLISRTVKGNLLLDKIPLVYYNEAD